jgi:tetratricopeptide (TPR) repeat protein
MRNLILVAVGVGFLCAASVRAQEGTGGVQPVDVYIRSARIALATNPPEYDRALKNLSAARDNYPQNYEVHFLLGSVWADKDEIDSMITEYALAKQYATEKEWNKMAKNLDLVMEGKWLERFNRAVTLVNHSDSLDDNLSEVEGQARLDSINAQIKGIRTTAKEALRHCTLLQPNDFRAYTTRGLIYQREGMTDSCLANFKTAERLFHTVELGDSATNFYDTTLLFTGPQGMPTDLFKDFEKKIKKLSDEKRTRYTNMLVSLVGAYYDAGDWKNTIMVARRHYAIEPDDINTIVTMADVFSRLDMEDEAFKWQEAVVRRDPGSKDTWYNMGIFYYNAAIRLQDSVGKYEKEVQADPKSAESVKNLTEFSRKRLENFARATPRFVKVVEIDSKDEDTWRLIAICRYSLASTIDDIRAAGDPGDIVSSIPDMSALGSLERDALWAEAEGTLSQAAGYFPEDENLCYMMKVTLAQLGKINELNEWKVKCP